ncbi:DUF4145 domain-containing protein [Microvirga sp. 17 mud 1-3]|uniref:DUF4145 domain-containing protein n=1 Tax=Microvirga sp. 17 mud 1-3 TaxID=2082949 RepID=UPI000D6B2440|nr:DUF4145 domain-containing protein [Microvirga sp. 17 mud 1-3]AWM88644.1 hypothetical protein C4E04_19195 [Microvirga sp. 17 mud 1-3]
MATKHVEPTLGAESFTCPHCGAIAHQTWFQTFGGRYKKDSRPHIPDVESAERVKRDKDIDEEVKEKLVLWFEKSSSKVPFFFPSEASPYNAPELGNVFVSECYSCNALSIWIADKLTYPHVKYEIEPNDDLPEEIRQDFLEAASIVNQSPRGAAALLRLCIQKLLKHLGESGTDINRDIGSLVKKGLDARMQKALDIVRVVGNEAVHPGSIDLRDDKATATKLFGLVNLIADQMITQPKHLDAMFEGLPEGKKQGIEQRDSKRD